MRVPIKTYAVSKLLANPEFANALTNVPEVAAQSPILERFALGAVEGSPEFKGELDKT